METLKNCRRRDLNPYRFLHTPLKRARLPFRHSDTNGIIQFSKLFILSSWRSNRFRFCPLHRKQHLVAFSSAECHSDTNGIIQFSKLFILSSWRSNRFRFCPLHRKQHLVAFSSAECHSDTNGIIQFSKLFILSSQAVPVLYISTKSYYK